MIAPVGYIPLVDLFNKAYDYENELYNYNLGGNKHVLEFFFEMPADIVQKWVMEFCENSLHLYNGSSEPIRISDQIFKTSFDWGSMYMSMGIDGGECPIEEFGFTYELLAPYKLSDPVSKDDISAFNARVKELSLKEDSSKAVFEDEVTQSLIEKYCGRRGFASPCLFLDHRSYTVSLNLFNHLAKFYGETRHGYLDEDAYYKADILRKFVGYSLCIPEKLYLKNWENFWKDKANRELQIDHMLQMYHNEGYYESESGLGSTIAGEREAENEFRNFISENGVQNITREEFYMKFGKGLTTRGKIRVWGAVAKDFPDLSKPGRKS